MMTPRDVPRNAYSDTDFCSVGFCGPTGIHRAAPVCGILHSVKSYRIECDMASPPRAFPSSKFRLLQAATGRIDSIASTGPPGSTRTGQGVVVTRKWMKLSAQGTVSYVLVRNTTDQR